jgi:hypothetical protein
VALTEETLPVVWREVLTLAPRLLASDLEKSEKPAISGPNTLVLRFPLRYNAAREYCQESSRVARVEEVLKRVTGQAWQLRVESISGGVSADPSSGDDTVTQPSRYRRQRAEAEQEPLLKRAIDVLGAQIVHMDEEFGAAPVAKPARPESTSTEGRQEEP